MKIWIWLFSCCIIIITFLSYLLFCVVTKFPVQKSPLGSLISIWFNYILRLLWALLCTHLCMFSCLPLTSLPTASPSALLAFLLLLVLQCLCSSGLSTNGPELSLFIFPGQTLPFQDRRKQLCLPSSRQVHPTAFPMSPTCTSHTQVSQTQYNKNHTYSLSSSVFFL